MATTDSGNFYNNNDYGNKGVTSNDYLRHFLEHEKVIWSLRTRKIILKNIYLC